MGHVSVSRLKSGQFLLQITAFFNIVLFLSRGLSFGSPSHCMSVVSSLECSEKSCLEKILLNVLGEKVSNIRDNNDLPFVCWVFTGPFWLPVLACLGGF